jgi:hypothetical protein
MSDSTTVPLTRSFINCNATLGVIGYLIIASWRIASMTCTSTVTIAETGPGQATKILVPGFSQLSTFLETILQIS